MSAISAITAAERLLPGEPAPAAEVDPRWQAIIEVADHIETEPELIWQFAARWGSHDQEDLRLAIATVVLEHLLEHHFDRLFQRVEILARGNASFARSLLACGKFGQSTHPVNAARLDRLLEEVRR